MRKESRANIIFFVVLLVLIAPGFVILMRKKLAGPTDPAHLPTLIPHQAAYIQPEPVPPRAPRIEPPTVRAWVEQQLHQRVSPDAVLARDTTGTGAVVGSRYVTQLLHINHARLVLLVWSGDADPVAIAVSGTEQSLANIEPEWIDVPKDIRHTLQSVGYTNPPERVAWVDVPLAQPLPPATKLQLSYANQTERLAVP